MDTLDTPIGLLGDHHPILLGHALLAVGLLLTVAVLAHLTSRVLGRLIEHHTRLQPGQRRAFHWLVEWGFFLLAILPACRLVGFNENRTLLTVGGQGVTISHIVMALVELSATLVLSGLAERVLINEHLEITFLTARQRARLGRLVRGLLLIFGLLGSASTVGLVTTAPVLSLGGANVSMFSIIVFVSTLSVVIVSSDLVGSFVGHRLLAGSDLDPGAQYAVGQLTYYFMLVLGMLVALQAVGVQLSSLTVVLGALGVGVGLGLQSVVNNFVCGLIVLLERPIQVGDVIELDGVRGRVRKIAARATTMTTSDNTTIIVPNADLISKRIVNWTHDDTTVRIKLPLLLDLSSSIDRVEKLILAEVVGNHWVLETPAPSVSITNFTSDGLAIEVGVSVNAATEGFMAAKSDLLRVLWLAFQREGIQLPSGEQVVILKRPEEPKT